MCNHLAYRLTLCVRYVPIYNYPIIPVFLCVYRPLFPFLYHIQLGIQILNACYYVFQLTIKYHTSILIAYYMRSTFFSYIHSQLQIPLLYNYTLLTMWFTLNYHIQLKFFLYAFILLHSSLHHSAFMTFL